MRTVLIAASALASVAVPGAASAQYYRAADVYAPPPAAYVAPAPMVQSQVYLAPGTTYVDPGATVVPGQSYDDQAVYMNGQRYYRDCWWDWGRRRCELKPWW
jgi:hypothetical protein